MNEINSVLQTNFPGYKKEIRVLMSQDREFRELAEYFVNYKRTPGKLTKISNTDLTQKHNTTTEGLKLELIERLRYKYLFEL